MLRLSWTPEPGPALCASLRTALQPLITEIWNKNAAAKKRWPTLCASLRSRNAWQHFTRTALYGHLQE